MHPLLTGSARLIEIDPVDPLPGGALLARCQRGRQQIRRQRRRVRQHGHRPNERRTRPPARSGTSPACRRRPAATSRSSGASHARAPLDLVAVAPTQALGQTATVKVAARNGDGSPDPGRAVRYAITGANPGAGAVTTAADGTAAISWTGAKVGYRHAHGLRRSRRQRLARRQQRAAADRARSHGRRAALRRRCPASRSSRRSSRARCSSSCPGRGRARATGPPKGFVPFTGAANIPVGSQLDTSKGRIELTSAADTGWQEDADVGLLPRASSRSSRACRRRSPRRPRR